MHTSKNILVRFRKEATVSSVSQNLHDVVENYVREMPVTMRGCARDGGDDALAARPCCERRDSSRV